MPAMEPSHLHRVEQPTTIAGYAQAIARALEFKGVDHHRVFRAAGVQESVVNDPLHRLPVESMSRLYQTCAEVTHDPAFGLTVARFVHVSHLHALGYALLASSTLRDFSRRLERYFKLVSQTGQVELLEKGREAHLISHMLYPVRPEALDAWLGTQIRIMRLMHSAELKPLRVELPYPEPACGAEPYEKFFDAPVQFGRPLAMLVLDAGVLDDPLNGSCPELAQFNDNIAAGYIAKLDRNDIVTSVRAKLIELLPTGQCSLAKVASAMAMSQALIRLRLAQRDTCFQDVLDEIRMELACSYLSQQKLSVTEIAFLLGYTDNSNFTRAFKRWSGVSPTGYRAGERGAGSEAGET